MKRTLAGFCACLALVAANAQDSRWSLITVSQNGTVVSIDTQSIHEEGGIVTLWVQHEHEQGFELINYKWSVKVLQREEYHCRPMLFGVLSVAKFDRSGDGLETRHTQHPALVPIVPDTTTEAVWRQICR